MSTSCASRGLCAALFALGAAACGGGEPATTGPDGSGEPIVRDSAGVRIVELPAGALTELPEWRLSDQPILSIGEVDGDEPYVLGGISGAVRFEDGGVAVFDPYASEIRVFDASGRYQTRFGGQGEGPGEFRAIRAMSRIQGDSIAIWDHFNQRVSIFSRDGVLGREYQTRECVGVGEGLGGLCLFADGFLEDGSLVLPNELILGPMPPESGPTDVTTITVGRVADGSYSVLDSLPQIDYYFSRLNGFSAGFRRRFGAFSAWAVAGPWVALGRGDARDIRIHEPGAGRLSILRLGDAPRPVTPADLAPYDDVDWGEREANARQWLRDFAAAPTVPLFGEKMYLDRAGRVWLSEYIPYRLGLEDDDLRYTVIDADGEALATIELPIEESSAEISFFIFQIDEDALLAAESDSLGVQRAVVYMIEGG